LQGERTPRPYLATAFSGSDAHFSPHGKWVAYTSNESERDEVYVRGFANPHESRRISTEGAASPRWAPAGNELYFLSSEGRLTAVKVELGTRLRVGTPTPLFDRAVGLGSNRYAAAKDGRRFLISVGTADSTAGPLTVILNWAARLRLRR
jgi:hypothetical protein